eukprot:m.51518 g.51518  ORF g.51518 m.51518 type:complete len:51 (+) comp10737_c0_seq5:275-427(+)
MMVLPYKLSNKRSRARLCSVYKEALEVCGKVTILQELNQHPNLKRMYFSD